MNVGNQVNNLPHVRTPNSVKVHPIKAFAIIITALALDALAIFAQQVSIMSPIFFNAVIILLNACALMALRIFAICVKNHPITSTEQLLQFLTNNPDKINTKIDFLEFKQVILSHLLVSGKLFTDDCHGDEDKIIPVLKAVMSKMDFSLVDESNLWGTVGFDDKGSGNNVLKSAVAAASASISGKPERRAIVAELLNHLQTKSEPLRKEIVDQGDNFPLGAHTIPEFLVRQGNEDLALQAVRMGATVTDDLLISALASAGTTKHGTELAKQLLRHYIDNNKKLNLEFYWKAVICLSAAPMEAELECLLDLVGCSHNQKYWNSIHYFNCIHVEGWIFNPFGCFSNQYRENPSTAWEARTTFLNTRDGLKDFKTLYDLFRQMWHEVD